MDADYRFRALGPAAVSYTTFDLNGNCGVIPDPISDNEVFAGGTITGNLCWEVKSSDAGNLLMYDDPFLGEDNLRTWYTLTP